MRPLRAPLRLAVASNMILALALAHVHTRTAHADVRVEGRIDSVRLEVRDASVHEALQALSATFELLVRNSAALDRPVRGTYQGSLQQVVARLLNGRDYVMIYSGSNIEIRIVDPGNRGNSRPLAGRSGAAVVPNVAAPAPASTPIVDRGRLIFVPR